MKLSTVLFLTTIFCTAALADQFTDPIQTITFAPTTLHEDESLTDQNLNLGFFIAGYTILGVSLIVAMIMVWVDEFRRHKTYDVDVENAVQQMKDLNMDIRQIESDFELVMKGKDPHAEEDEVKAAFN